ncbi:MAG: hypothetical protein CMG67_02525 [Candidatus Marinimicrobia bacterium]|nr:hypothetical protein [Candidatus Neomarinimicrobiota bacterium]
MTKRKKKNLLIQSFIFILAIVLLYNTYKDKDQKPERVSNNTTEKAVINEDEKKTNRFENVEYKGIDLNGNRYTIKSEIADFELETPNKINMNIMTAIFYFKDGSVLKVRGDRGTYNNQNYNMTFRDNIVAEYGENFLFADKLDYLNTDSLLTISGNVRTESVKGDMLADNLVFDISEKTLDVSMFTNNQVNVKLRN